MFKRLISAGLLFGMAATAPPAFAANCAMRDTVVEQLHTAFSETQTGIGLQGNPTNPTMIEIWSSQDTGTFTVIVTTPVGISCVLATGTDWYQAKPNRQPGPETPDMPS